MNIPKEQQTAYERWEMSSFTEGHPSISGIKAKKKEEDTVASEKISQVFESARKEAYTKGMQEGFAVGMAKAREYAQEEKQHFLKLMESFSDALEKSDEQIADDALSLALEIAKAMLKVKLNIDTSIVLPVVMDAIHYLPYVQKPARILVHHEDAQMLREYLAEEIASQHWQIQEDINIERGGCIVETGANQIDATNEVRWKRISDALAQKSDWLLP
ncbi:FliH/SctL family protein [Methylotenera sp.]|uniref:FliH/SctL family protein n=2 Tax=Methylotenera sp. TaxID=2051956 RepID=UPI00272FA726|nr:FliH/SctL family protein [Methylotenera sp.]MDP2229818.1 FliH/SctL family protein [Methylotenera sp.]MDP3140417.1 FliH/SctL family protein [Methylotenera sp.]